ncbi:MAG: hypothetical protein ACAH95_03180 [Fimbriimonas sp.]
MKKPLISPRFGQWLNYSVYMFAAFTAFHVVVHGQFTLGKASECFIMSMLYGAFVIAQSQRHRIQFHYTDRG